MTPDTLAGKLWRAAMLRGLTALAITVYVLSQQAGSPVVVARACASYWIVDGLLTLWAGTFAAAFALNRVVLVLRGCLALGAGLAVFALPLADVFAAWQPGQLLLLMSVATLALGVFALQVVAGALDTVICLALRRRIPGEWSVATGAALSVLFALIAAATFIASPGLLTVALAATASTGGFSLLSAALALRERLSSPPPVPARHGSAGRAVRHLAVIVTVMGLLAGCASSSTGGWAKSGATPQDVARDDRDCLAGAQMIVSGPQGPRTEIRQDRYRRCMHERGYAEAPTK